MLELVALISRFSFFDKSILFKEIENLNDDQVNKILPIINDMKNLISLWK